MPFSLDDLTDKQSTKTVSDLITGGPKPIDKSAADMQQQDRPVGFQNLKALFGGPPPNYPTELPSANPQLAAGIGAGMTNVAQGVGQRFGMVSPQDVAEKRRLDAPLMSTGYGKFGNLVGEAAPYMAGGALMPAAGGILGSVLQGGAQGAVQGALAPTAPNESVGTNAIIGGVSGGVLGGAAGVLGKLVSPNTVPSPQRADALKRAKDLGMEIPIGQQTGNDALKGVDEALKTLPATSGRMAGMAEKNQGIINQTIAKGIGQPGADALTPEVMAKARMDLNNKFQQLSKGAVLDTSTPDFAKALTDVKAELSKLDPDVAKQVLNQIKPKLAMLEKWQQQGSVPGEIYQANRRFLSDAAFADQGGPTGRIYKQLIAAMDSAAPNTPEWSATRTAWSLLKSLGERNNVVTPLGDVKGPALGSVLKSKNPTAYMENNMGPAGDVARVADTFKTDVPNSGTAQRNFWINAITNPLSMGGAGAATGGALGYYTGGQEGAEAGALGGLTAGVLGPKAIQGVLYNPSVQKYILSGGMGPGVAAALKRSLPPAGVAGILAGSRSR